MGPTGLVSRRKLLAAGGTGLIVGAAGCVGDRPTSAENDDESADDSSADDNSSDASDLAPPVRWIPTSAGSDMFYTYTDLVTVRAHRDVLPAETVEEISFMPRGEGGRIVARLQDEPTFEYVLEFGPEGDGGHYVMHGEYDLSGLDVGEPVDQVGEFDVFDAAGASVAASNDILVVVDPEIGRIDDVLSAGIDGTNRRSDEDDAFRTVLDSVGGDTLAVGIVSDGADGGGTAMGQSWTVESETTSFTRIMVGGSVSRMNEDELRSKLDSKPITDGFETLSVDIEGNRNTAIATGSLPTAEFQYVDSFSKHRAGISRPIRANISIEVDTAAGAVTVTLTSIGATGHVEVRDGDGTQATLTESGEEATLEYDRGESETVTVVGVSGDQETVIASKTVEF